MTLIIQKHKKCKTFVHYGLVVRYFKAGTCDQAQELAPEKKKILVHITKLYTRIMWGVFSGQAIVGQGVTKFELYM